MSSFLLRLVLATFVAALLLVGSSHSHSGTVVAAPTHGDGVGRGNSIVTGAVATHPTGPPPKIVTLPPPPRGLARRGGSGDGSSTTNAPNNNNGVLGEANNNNNGVVREANNNHQQEGGYDKVACVQCVNEDLGIYCDQQYNGTYNYICATGSSLYDCTTSDDTFFPSSTGEFYLYESDCTGEGIDDEAVENIFRTFIVAHVIVSVCGCAIVVAAITACVLCCIKAGQRRQPPPPPPPQRPMPLPTPPSTGSIGMPGAVYQTYGHPGLLQQHNHHAGMVLSSGSLPKTPVSTTTTMMTIPADKETGQQQPPETTHYYPYYTQPTVMPSTDEALTAQKN